VAHEQERSYNLTIKSGHFEAPVRDIPVTEVKAKLLHFLDEVERGATFRLTRHGRPIARIVPEQEARREESAQAAAEIRAIGRRSRGMTVAEILLAKDEGRRF
jgi:prevent-host-death family protein